MPKLTETLATFEAIHDKLINGVYKEQTEKLLEEQGLAFKPL